MAMLWILIILLLILVALKIFAPQFKDDETINKLIKITTYCIIGVIAFCVLLVIIVLAIGFGSVLL